MLSVIVSAVVLTGLVLTYILIQKNRAYVEDNNEEPAVEEDEAIVLIDKPRSDITKITYTNENGVFAFLQLKTDDGTEWVLETDPSFPLYMYTVNLMISPLFYLSPSEMLTERPESLADYGLDFSQSSAPVYAKAEYSDGSAETVFIGDKTPAGDFYYIMHEGDGAVYLLAAYFGDRFLYGYDDIIDKTIPRINFTTLYYADIKEKDKPEIELKFQGFQGGGTDKASFTEHINTIGSTLIGMQKPYPGKDVYLSSFTYEIESFDGYALGRLAEYACKDFSVYGLDVPELEIVFEDYSQTLRLLVGDYADDEQTEVYARLGDSDNVYLMKASYLSGFRNLNPFKFIERFVVTPLPNIGIVDSIKVESSENGRSHDLRMNHADDPPLADGSGEIFPTVDGTAVDSEDFRMFYRAVLGLAIDAQAYDYKITEPPLVTVTYFFNYSADRENVVTHYYPYDTNFYAVSIDGSDTVFLVNKQNMRIMFEYIDAMLH